MKAILLFLCVFTTFVSIGQDSLELEHAQARIQLFNDSITQLLEYYESKNLDFIAVRSNHNYGPNCRLYLREDTCTNISVLRLGEERLIDYIHVGLIQASGPKGNRPRCYKEVDRIYAALTDEENYFQKTDANFSHYDPTKIIFFGFVSGNYMYEVIEPEYFSTHRPGWFYQIFQGNY